MGVAMSACNRASSVGVNSHPAFDEKPGIKFVWPNMYGGEGAHSERKDLRRVYGGPISYENVLLSFDSSILK